MSRKTDRRAAEREARNLAFQQHRERAPQMAQLAAGLTTEPQLAPPALVAIQTRQAINRANAQHSTGPVTLAGKTNSSRNSLKHGLTGNTVLLDADDAAEYQSRLDYYTSLYQPDDFEECRLVQAIHDANWRLDRITHLESTIYAKGRIELENCFEEIPSEQRKSFIELETTQRYAKDLRNFHIHEARLQRQRTKDLAALLQLQQQRAEVEAEAAQIETVTESVQSSATRSNATVPAGFVFAISETVADSPAFASQPSLYNDAEAA